MHQDSLKSISKESHIISLSYAIAYRHKPALKIEKNKGLDGAKMVINRNVCLAPKHGVSPFLPIDVSS